MEMVKTGKLMDKFLKIKNYQMQQQKEVKKFTECSGIFMPQHLNCLNKV
jgi:hypothetical protein